MFQASQSGSIWKYDIHPYISPVGICNQGDPHKKLAFALASYAFLKSPYQQHQPYLPLAPGGTAVLAVEQSANVDD